MVRNLDELRDDRGFYFTIIGNRIIEDTTLNAYDKTTYMVLSKFVSVRDNTCFPSLKILCELVGASKNTILKSIETLEKRGYIQKFYRFAEEKKKGKIVLNKKIKTSNLYVITGLAMERGSSPDEPGVVHHVNQGSSPDEPGVVHHVNMNYNQSNYNNLTKKGTKKSKGTLGHKKTSDKYDGFYL